MSANTAIIPHLIPPSLVLLSLQPHTWPCLCLHIHPLQSALHCPLFWAPPLFVLSSSLLPSPLPLFTPPPQFVCTGSRHCMRSRTSTGPGRAQGLPPWTEGKLSIRTPHSSWGRGFCQGGVASTWLRGRGPRKTRHPPLKILITIPSDK